MSLLRCTGHLAARCTVNGKRSTTRRVSKIQVRRGIHTTVIIAEKDKDTTKNLEDIMASFLSDNPDTTSEAKQASDFAGELDSWSSLSADEPTKRSKKKKPKKKGKKAPQSADDEQEYDFFAQDSKKPRSRTDPEDTEDVPEQEAPFDPVAALEGFESAHKIPENHPEDKPMDWKPIKKTLDKMGLDSTPAEDIAYHKSAMESRYYKGEKPETMSLLDQMMPETEDPEEGLFDKYFDSDEMSATGLHDLKLWDLYPKQIKRWMIYTKTPLGVYDANGLWAASGRTPVTKYNKPEDKGVNHFESVDDELGSQYRTRELLEIPVDDVEGLMSKKTLNKIFEEEQRALPPDLRSRFRFGVTWDELKDIHPKIKRLFSMKNATPGEISEARKRDLVERYGRWPADTGYPPVQVATYTFKINKLEEHMSSNRQDKDNKYRLMRMKIRRKGMLKYMKEKDPAMYYRLVQELSLKDDVKCWKYFTIG